MTACSAKLCRAIGLDALPADPRFATNALRLENIRALTAALEERFATDTREHWVALMRGAGVPCGSVRRPGEALDSAEAAARDMVREVDHPRVGRMRTVASPLRLSGTPVIPVSPAPTLGQHNEEILADLRKKAVLF